jgi:Primase X
MKEGNNQIVRDRKQLREAMDGIDFLMELFELPRFPRNVATGATARGQRSVNSRDDVLMYYEAARYEDCYMSAFLNYKESVGLNGITADTKPVPNHIVVDLDRDSFMSDAEFEAALAVTLENIKNSVTGLTAKYPVVIWTGNGYHVHVPLPGFTTPLEDMPEFAAFKDDKDLPNKFLRWAEKTLSNGAADPHHNLSIKSALFRVPGTINTKARAAGKDPQVKIVQGMEYALHRIGECHGLPSFEQERVLSKPTTKFLNDFLGHLIQGVIDEKVAKLKRRRMNIGMITHGYNNNNNGKNRLVWIDTLLKTGIEDGRKNLLYWVIAPYLITIKGMDYDDAYHVIESSLEKCDQIRSLDPSWDSFRYRIRYCLDTAEDQERKPIRFETFKEYYPDVYESLKLSGGS